MHGGDDKLNSNRGLDSNLPTISAIVPFRDSEWCVLDCLRSLLDMDYPMEKLEVIAVDDHCDDMIASRIQRLFPTVRLLRNKHSLGCDGSKQAAIKVASGDILAVTDADCKVGTAWAGAIAKDLSGSADIVTGPVRHPKTFLRELIGICDFQDSQGNRCVWSNAFTGCNVAIRREILSAVQYQRDVGNRFGSDRLSSWEMHKNGFRILYEPLMTVWHFPAITPNNLIERRIRYGKKALSLRRMDNTLPGAAIIRLGLLAIPAYVLYKSAKDVWCTSKMACAGTVNPWHTPLLLPALFICRIVDAAGIASIIFSINPVSLVNPISK